MPRPAHGGEGFHLVYQLVTSFIHVISNVLHSLDGSEITPLLDESRDGSELNVLQKVEEVIFNLERANRAFADSFLKQSMALSKVKSADEQ